jgi:PadR family transcriptional regulator PadR
MAAKRPRVLTLSAKESLILELLVEQDELYGLQLVAASRRKLKRGTVYVTLGRMEEKGYITSRLEDAPADVGGMPRRLYQPTPLGRRVLAAFTTAATHLMPEFAR